MQIDLELGADADPEELDRASGELLEELRALDVDRAERRSGGEAPAGARGMEVAALGSLVVTLGRGTLGAVAGVLQDWLARRTGRTVKLTLGGDSIELSGGSAAYQRQMIETFLAAHAAG